MSKTLRGLSLTQKGSFLIGHSPHKLRRFGESSHHLSSSDQSILFAVHLIVGSSGTGILAYPTKPEGNRSNFCSQERAIVPSFFSEAANSFFVKSNFVICLIHLYPPSAAD